MTNLYWIYANISGSARWHLVYDKRPGLLFIQEDFEEEEYDIEAYKVDFPHNEVIDVPNAHQIKNPLGICDNHKKMWNRVDCPLCDFLFVFDRLKLAVDQISLTLSELETEDSKKAKKRLKNFLDYCRIGQRSTCTCDEQGESRCPKHGLSDLAEQCRTEQSNE